MKINGIANKITGNLDKIAFAYGIFADPLQQPDKIEWMMDRISKWHIPDPQVLLQLIKGNAPYYDNLKNAVMLYLAGEGLKLIGQGKYGNAAQKAGVGLAKGVAVASLLWLPAINDSGLSATTAGTKVRPIPYQY